MREDTLQKTSSVYALQSIRISVGEQELEIDVLSLSLRCRY